MIKKNMELTPEDKFFFIFFSQRPTERKTMVSHADIIWGKSMVYF